MTRRKVVRRGRASQARPAAQEAAGTLPAAVGAEARAGASNAELEQPKRGPGRPRKMEQRVWRTVCLEAATFEHFQREALRSRCSVAEAIRRVLNDYVSIRGCLRGEGGPR